YQGGRRRTAVVDADLLRPQPPRLRCVVVEPPGRADVEDMAGAFPGADGEDGLATQTARKAKLPAGLSAAVAVDQQVVLAGKRLDRLSHHPEGVHDLRRDRRDPGQGCHGPNSRRGLPEFRL